MEIRHSLVQIIFLFIDLEFSEDEIYLFLDMKIIQIIILWTLEKKHNTHLTIFLDKLFNYLIQIKADQFLLEIILKTDLLILFQDIINQIYISDVPVPNRKLDNLLCFIKTIMIKLIEIVNFSSSLISTQETLSKSVSFINISRALKA